MRILMISLDRGLLGQSGSGDVVERHRDYARQVERLDIIVYSKKSQGYNEVNLAGNAAVYPTRSGSRLGFIFDALRLADRIQKTHGRFDLVSTQDPFATGFVGYLLKRKFGAKLQINFHGDFWDNPYSSKAQAFSWLYQAFSRYLVSQADAVRVVSSGIKQKLMRRGVDEAKIAVLPTPVNEALFSTIHGQNTLLRQDFGDNKVILYAGRLAEEKNLPALLRAFAAVLLEVPGSMLVLAGSGPVEQTLRTQSEALNISKVVRFTGALPQDKLADYYLACDLVVLPSFTESLGKVLMEAALAKKPVVATRTTGALDIVVDGVSGFLVEIGNERTLADKMIVLLRDPNLSRRMGEAGYELVKKNFNRESIVRGIVDLWRRTIG